VDRTAPVAEPVALRFDLVSRSGVVGHKEVWLEIGPPTVFSLEQNYPNPFAERTTFVYELPHSGRVVLTVFDVLGRRVATLADDTMEAGRHEVTWNATGLSSGTYVYRLVAEDESGQRNVQQRRLTLVR
jgi:hypothetical protein